MRTSTSTGRNRTGAQMSPLDAKKMRDVADATGGALLSPPPSAIREHYLMDADRIGSVPPPGTIDGVVESIKEIVSGHRPQVLIDKLGERLAFERSGVRLYEALIARCFLISDDLPPDMLETLQDFKEEELQHFKLVHDAMMSMGADPTAETPSADVAGVEGSGLVKVITDPRTTLPQALHAILAAELIDNAGWESLIELVSGLQQDDLVEQFQQALDSEELHEEQVKRWLNDLTVAEALRENRDAATTH